MRVDSCCERCRRGVQHRSNKGLARIHFHVRVDLLCPVLRIIIGYLIGQVVTVLQVLHRSSHRSCLFPPLLGIFRSKANLPGIYVALCHLQHPYRSRSLPSGCFYRTFHDGIAFIDTLHSRRRYSGRHLRLPNEIMVGLCMADHSQSGTDYWANICELRRVLGGLVGYHNGMQSPFCIHG